MTITRLYLVHGWNSHPGVWNRLVPRLEAASLPYWRFDHSAMAGEGLAGRAAALKTYVDGMRDGTGYDGPVDVVCHSFGACIARQCLEVADGAARRARVRQLIMLGPPNNGSALAELFSDPDRGPEVIGPARGGLRPAGVRPARGPDRAGCAAWKPGDAVLSGPPASGTTLPTG